GYVLRYADLPGFSRSEQQLIAVLVRGHRRKFPVDAFKDLPKRLIEPTRRLCVLLRLAVILHRGHRRQHLPAIQAQARKSKLELSFPDGWLDEHPLTRADLLAEAQLLKKVDFKLSFS
ncbi:MAG: exopolyphosphatase, partial [Candidatus Competibacteraceae bacterium]|nr:exopolyphosphatase [Candidatus Competibacteraceae bacterium]